MADKVWGKVTLEGSAGPSPNEVGQLRPELTIELYEQGKKYPKAGITMFYDDIDPLEWPRFVQETWKEPLEKVQKFGFTFQGAPPLAFLAEATIVPNGKLIKVEKQLIKGLSNATDFGDRESKKRGRSTSEEWDDDGKEKKDKHKK